MTDNLFYAGDFEAFEGEAVRTHIKGFTECHFLLLCKEELVF